MLSVFAAAAVLQAALFYKHSSYHWTPLVEKPAKDPVLCSPGIYMYLKWMGYFDGRVFVVLISDIVYVLSFDRVVKREEWLSNSLKCVHDQSFEMILLGIGRWLRQECIDSEDTPQHSDHARSIRYDTMQPGWCPLPNPARTPPSQGKEPKKDCRFAA